MLESKIYPNPEVQQFLSASYVGVLLQSESPEGEKLLHKYKMPGIPSLFVMDAEGNVVGKMCGAPPSASAFMSAVNGMANGQSH